MHKQFTHKLVQPTISLKIVDPEPVLCFVPQVPDTRVRWFGTYHWKLRVTQKVESRTHQHQFTCSPCLQSVGTSSHASVTRLSLVCSLSGCPRARKSGIKIVHSKENKEDQEPIRYDADADQPPALIPFHTRNTTSYFPENLLEAEAAGMRAMFPISHFRTV